MIKVVFLLSHIPNPRILKRVKALDSYKKSIVYWDRDLKVKESFTVDSKVNVKDIKVSSPVGKPLKRIFPLLKFSRKALKELRNQKPDIIHATNLDMLLISVIYLRLYGVNTKITYEVADLPKYCFKENLMSIVLKKIEVSLTRHVSLLILTSPFFWESYFSAFFDKEKYLLIPNAPYKSLFCSYKKKSYGKLTIGFVGSIRYVDQIKMLIDVIENEKHEVNIILAGSGPGFEEISNFVKGKDFVNMLGPYNYDRDIVSIYEKIDITYSVYDMKLDNVKIALPNRLYESIVCELPIIASKGTELGNFIERKGIGYTVSSYSELNDLISKILLNPDILDVTSRASKLLKENYYYENFEKQFIDSYRELILWRN